MKKKFIGGQKELDELISKLKKEVDSVDCPEPKSFPLICIYFNYESWIGSEEYELEFVYPDDFRF